VRIDADRERSVDLVAERYARNIFVTKCCLQGTLAGARVDIKITSNK